MMIVINIYAYFLSDSKLENMRGSRSKAKQYGGERALLDKE